MLARFDVAGVEEHEAAVAAQRAMQRDRRVAARLAGIRNEHRMWRRIGHERVLPPRSSTDGDRDR